MNPHTKTPNIAVMPLGDQLAEGTARNALRRLFNRLRPRRAGAANTHGTEQSTPCPRPASKIEVRVYVRHRTGQTVTICVLISADTKITDLYPAAALALALQHDLVGVEVLQVSLAQNYAHAPNAAEAIVLADWNAAKAQKVRNG